MKKISKDYKIHNPIVLDMTEEEIKSLWDHCKKCSYELAESEGMNMMAASGADPGIVSCPYCDTTHWRIGRQNKCTNCNGIYLTDWWSMYSWGCGAGRRKDHSEKIGRTTKKPDINKRRLCHPAYKWGYEHPVEDPWKERSNQPWKKILKPENYDMNTIKRIY